MKQYKTTNELNHLRFDQATVCEFTIMQNAFEAVFDAVVILPENTTNRDMFEMGANDLTLTIEEGKITKFIKEGYTRYDANGEFLEKTEDEVVPEADYKATLKELAGCEMLSVEQNGSDYIFSVDTTYHIYCIHVTGTKDVEEWDRYIKIN